MLRLKRLNCSVKLFMTTANREKRSISSLSFSTRLFNFHHYDSKKTFFSGGMIALTSVKMRCENSELLWKPKTRSLSSRVISTDLNKLIWCVDFPDFHEIGQNVCQILMHQSKLGVKKFKILLWWCPERDNNRNIFYCPASCSFSFSPTHNF